VSETDRERVFYDGGCGFCHAAVRFVAVRDTAGRFRFAPRGGETFLASVPPCARASLPASIVVSTRDGRLLVRSAAVLHLMDALGGKWRLLGRLLGWIPAPLLDLGYRGVARIRRALAPTPEDVCPVVPPGIRERFDP
jgi:predicted DCC family thiol-disulfide oxidoreductase YuxK